jgi:alpha-L-fucosidase
MAMFADDPVRPPLYRRFERPIPSWYDDAKLGIFVHWGPYSVPAWAEPIGALGTFDDDAYWFAHNPYAEWYFNTIRIPGSPAARHHAERYADAPYDDFLDAWRAERFDADAMIDLVARSGARYVVPTTKHHDGVTLWDAPGTGDRNTVHRGPRRDLVEEFRAAAERRGIRFGVYYSGGLDWHAAPTRPISGPLEGDLVPRGRAYADYAFDHVADLIERYRPALLWGDIDWPDAGRGPGGKSLADLFASYYERVPDGVVNDRFGLTHWDFRTSEYAQGANGEGAAKWENTRGIGFSFGYNRIEDAATSMSGPDAVRHFVDVVSRGGNLLLNVGPTAAGDVPEPQRRTLEHLGAWNERHGEAVFGSRALDPAVAEASDEPFMRWTTTPGWAHAFVAAEVGVHVPLRIDPARVDPTRVRCVGPGRVDVAHGDVVVSAGGADTCIRVSLALRE